MDGTPGYSRDSRVQGALQASPHGTPGEEDSARVLGVKKIERVLEWGNKSASEYGDN